MGHILYKNHLCQTALFEILILTRIIGAKISYKKRFSMLPNSPYSEKIIILRVEQVWKRLQKSKVSIVKRATSFFLFLFYLRRREIEPEFHFWPMSLTLHGPSISSWTVKFWATTASFARFCLMHHHYPHSQLSLAALVSARFHFDLNSHVF